MHATVVVKGNPSLLEGFRKFTQHDCEHRYSKTDEVSYETRAVLITVKAMVTTAKESIDRIVMQGRGHYAVVNSSIAELSGKARSFNLDVDVVCEEEERDMYDRAEDRLSGYEDQQEPQHAHN